MNGLKLIKLIKKVNGKDIRTFLLFLLISILVWQIEKLRQTYPEDTELNIICEDVPEGYITSKGLDKSVKVRLEGDGFSLLRMYVTNHRNIRVSLKHLSRLSSGGSMWAIFIPRRLAGVKNDLPEHVRITDVFTDTVMIPLLTVKKRKLPVIVQDNVSLQPQYTYSAPKKVTPDSVIVTATNDIMDTLIAVYTTKQNPISLNDTVVTQMELILPELATANTSFVTVEYDVEPFSEKKLSVPIEPINVPNGYTGKIFPPQARISFNVGLSKYERADIASFRVIADFSTIHPGDKESRVRISLLKSPKFADNISISPSYAEFILEKNK